MHPKALTIALLFLATLPSQAYEIRPDSEASTRAEAGQPDCAVPRYTQELLESFETGKVRLAFTVNADGKTERVDVVSSSGSAQIDAESLKAVRGCTFKPVVLNGMAMTAQVVVPFDWVIPGLVKPRLLADSDCRPGYPRSAREKAPSGTTVMSFLVKTSGELTEPRLIRSSGSQDLDAATKGLTDCKAVPGSLNGEPKDMRLLVSYVWRVASQ